MQEKGEPRQPLNTFIFNDYRAHSLSFAKLLFFLETAQNYSKK